MWISLALQADALQLTDRAWIAVVHNNGILQSRNVCGAGCPLAGQGWYVAMSLPGPEPACNGFSTGAGPALQDSPATELLAQPQAPRAASEDSAAVGAPPLKPLFS